MHALPQYDGMVRPYPTRHRGANENQKPYSTRTHHTSADVRTYATRRARTTERPAGRSEASASACGWACRGDVLHMSWWSNVGSRARAGLCGCGCGEVLGAFLTRGPAGHIRYPLPLRPTHRRERAWSPIIASPIWWWTRPDRSVILCNLHGDASSVDLRVKRVAAFLAPCTSLLHIHDTRPLIHCQRLFAQLGFIKKYINIASYLRVASLQLLW